MMRILNALGFNRAVENPKSIYIGSLGGVGDLVLVSSPPAELKKKFPKAKITFGMGAEAFHSIIANNPNIDEFDTSLFYYPPTKNIRKLLFNKIAFHKRKLKFDLVIFFNNEEGKKLRKGNHIVDNIAQLCGVTLSYRRPIVYLNKDDIAQGEIIIRQAGIKKAEPFIVLGPETRFAKDSKEWPVNKFRELVAMIHRKFSVKIITFVPPASRKEYPGTVVIKNTPTMRSIAAVIKRVSLYIGCDNGLTHIASAFGMPIISIHSGYLIEYCGSLSPNTVFVSSPPFLPADKRPGPHIDPNPITVIRVFEEVEKALVPVIAASKLSLDHPHL